MSRGLGKLQREVKAALDMLMEHGVPTRFADLRMWCIVCNGGEENDQLEPTCERSLRRALRGLVDRGDVLAIAGNGGRRNPYHYMTVETFARMATGKVKGSAHAKRVVGGMIEEVTMVMVRKRRAK